MADLAPYHDRDGFIVRQQARALARGEPACADHALHYASAGIRRERPRRRIFELTQHSQRLYEAPRRWTHHSLQRGGDRSGLPRHGQGQQAHRF